MVTARNFVDKFISETLFSDFYFFNVGREGCERGHSYGPDMREEYLIHYVVSGVGVFQTQGISYRLSQGDFFLIRPQEVVYYEADKKDPWTYFWFGFTGTKVEEILRMNGITQNDCVGSITNTKEINQLFYEIFNSNLFDASENLRNQGSFYRLFAHFKTNEKNIFASNLEARKQRYSESFLLYVQTNYYHDILTITGIAESMSLNSSYLTQVIKEELKVTPLEYLTEYRMKKAKVLLLSSDLPIYEVAYKVGYKSSHSFSRVFKQREGMSPLEHVKKNKNS